ncbi:hypothetical protein [Lysobacter gummosus]|uniref:hypothetical protein n=1 Tax=Lysobacter gummosus TaxID=262324 RepID=UPI0036304EB7
MASRRFDRAASGLKPFPQKTSKPRGLLWEGLEPRCFSPSSGDATCAHNRPPQFS